MTEAEYKDIFNNYQYPDLIQLWDELKNTTQPFIRTATLQGVVKNWEKGKAFEYLIMRLLELDGAEVEYPYFVQGNHPRSDQNTLEQIDGLFYYQQYVGLVECKNLSHKVSNGTIATLRSQLMRRPSALVGNIFSISGFTEPAITLATHLHPQTILLWNEQDIQYVIDNKCICQGFVTKFKQYATRCIPDYRLM